MWLALLSLGVIVVLAFGYRTYGAFVARQYQLQANADTPAHRHQDGVDYVPTRPFYLFGQHFSAIAAAGPIVGPILACQQFGWAPAILWITLGVIFIGAVHDVSTLVASVRHDAKSIAEVVRAHMGRPAWLAVMAFIWLSLVYVIVAFTDITAGTFVSGDKDVAGMTFRFNPGGAVALAAVLYLVVALVMGLVQRVFAPPLWLATLVFVPLTGAAVWLGTRYSTLLVVDWRMWIAILLVYCAIASVAPVWLLLQPRGYLGGFVLYVALAVGTLGILLGNFTIHQPAFANASWFGDGANVVFPFLFVTIACGACSGFHGLVCSGTTSKQIDREADCRPIGYGAMLLEAFVALIALATVMIASDAGTGGGPGATYARGMGMFFHRVFGINPELAATFGAMALSTFVFDTLDSATRLGRYILQELLGRASRASAVAATAATVGLPLGFLLVGGKDSFRAYWTLFGTSNQLLAALSLLAVAVWLHRRGKTTWFVLFPSGFLLATTVTSLVLQLVHVGSSLAARINGLAAALLLLLAGFLVVQAATTWRNQAGGSAR